MTGLYVAVTRSTSAAGASPLSSATKLLLQRLIKTFPILKSLDKLALTSIIGQHLQVGLSGRPEIDVAGFAASLQNSFALRIESQDSLTLVLRGKKADIPIPCHPQF